MKNAADFKRMEISFKIGEQVFLKLQPYRQSSLARRPCEKLAARVYGPFQIVQKVGKVAYKLEFPPYCKIHPIFHVSQLKRCVGTTPVFPTIPEQLSPELELCVEPGELLAVRHVQEGQSLRKVALIQWKNLPTFEATWEEVATLSLQLPAFNLGRGVM